MKNKIFIAFKDKAENLETIQMIQAPSLEDAWTEVMDDAMDILDDYLVVALDELPDPVHNDILGLLTLEQHGPIDQPYQIPDYDLRQYVKAKPHRQTRTAYHRWLDGDLPGLGSFHTTLLQAYKIADDGNREQLEKGFPDWFCHKRPG